MFQFLDYFRVEGVVHPTSLAPVLQDAGIFQNFEMERETRLPGFKQVGQVTNTLLTLAQAVDDLQPRLIRECVEPPRDARDGFFAKRQSNFRNCR